MTKKIKGVAKYFSVGGKTFLEWGDKIFLEVLWQKLNLPPKCLAT